MVFDKQEFETNFQQADALLTYFKGSANGNR